MERTTRSAGGPAGRRYALAATAVALTALGACGKDDTSGDASESGSGTQLRTEEVGGVGTVLADTDGMTLYTNEAESDGTIKCVDACVDFWSPLDGDAPDEIDGVDGTFGDVKRPDGIRQVTLDGQPLYTFVDDRAPGSARGDGFEDDFEGDHFIWHVVPTGSESPPPDGGDDGGIYGY